MNREQSHRPAAPDRDRVTWLDLAIFGRHPARGQDVGHEQHLFVLDAVVGDRERADVGVRHADVLGLPARIAAGQVRVAEDARGGLAVGLAPGVLLVGGIAVVAARILLLAAMVALPARDRKRHDHALACLERARRADLDHLAHEFVAEHVARLHRRNVAVVEVQVGAADRRRSDPDDGVARVEDLGIVDGFAADVVLAVPGDRFHDCCSVSVWSSPRSSRWRRLRALVAISPVSMSCLKRWRSRRVWMRGSRWNSLAMNCPTAPPGGS